MDWLVITENQEKAAAIRRALPEAVVLSSKGLPWAPEIELYGSDISYRKLRRESHRDRLNQAETAALECDRILLAFDPTTAGEACAAGFEDLLGPERCARWNCTSLDPKDIRAAIGALETLSGREMPKSSRGLAESYWVQTAMDITWTAQITRWLKEKTSREEKITRLMAGLLKMVVDEKRKREIFSPKSYWTLHCRISTPGADTTGHAATAVVPALHQLRPEATPKTREIWKRKIQEAKIAAGAGRGLPQPEPGFPWRFESREEAAAQKTHLEKFPYFLMEAADETPKKSPGAPPHTTDTILEVAAEARQGKAEEIEAALADLYHSGWITHPKSTNPNLSKKTVERLHSHGVRTGLDLEREPKTYGDSGQHGRWPEAIRPTSWERTPEKASAVIPEGATRTRKLWLYREIYRRALESQMPAKEEPSLRLFLLGPLYIRRRAAQEKRGKSFHAAKETKLGAHMNIILSAGWQENDPPQEDAVLECRCVEIQEKSMEAPPPLSEDTLFMVMGDEGLGKRDTLRKRLGELKRQGSVETRNGEIYLTESGKALAKTLGSHFGQFLDKNYHRTVAESLRQIESNEADPQEFLKEWWDCFRTYLEEES